LKNLPEDRDLREICKRLKDDLPYYAASGISAKNQFADRYQTDFPNMSRQYYDACIAYYQKVIELEHDNYASYDRLASLHSAIGDEAQAKADYKIMLPILQKVATENNAAALVLLGDLYKTGLAKTRPPDENQAFEYYKKASELGNVYAYLRVANCFYKGNGVSKNIDEAFQWYQKSADIGIDDGEYMVGMLSYQGNSSNAPDFKRAFEYFSKAAEKGHIMAQIGLGSLFFTGKAGKKDIEQSYFWFKRAADSGNIEAGRIVQMFKSEGMI
jgi:TPR repeat protein